MKARHNLPTIRVRGRQGQWFSDCGQFGLLPTAHWDMFTFDKVTQTGKYHHPDNSCMTPGQQAKVPAYVEALRTGRRVVLTKDDFTKDEDNRIVAVKRKPRSYQGIWEYDEVRIDFRRSLATR